jgi:phage regulator Rha-like protein
MKNKQGSAPEPKTLAIIPDERIIGKIYFIRGEKVMFDYDLAVLYEVKTKELNKAVKRNIKRFPDDFMFKLNKEETNIFSRFQIGTLKKDKRGQNIKYLPYVFTEPGVAMLSAVLKSERAIDVSVQIVRVFIKMRKLLLTNKELREKIEKMEGKYDEQFKVVFKVLANFMKTDPKNRSGELKIIGFTDRKAKK